MPTYARERARRRTSRRGPAPSTPLRELRRARTLTQDLMARLLRVSQQTYAKYEAGACLPAPPKRERIATILGTTPIELWPSSAVD